MQRIFVKRMTHCGGFWIPKKDPKICQISLQQVSACSQNIKGFLSGLWPNLANSSCGWLPIWPHHKIWKKENKKKKIIIVVQRIMSLPPNLWLPLIHVFMFVILKILSKWSQCGILGQNLNTYTYVVFFECFIFTPKKFVLALDMFIPMLVD